MGMGINELSRLEALEAVVKGLTGTESLALVNELALLREDIGKLKTMMTAVETAIYDHGDKKIAKSVRSIRELVGAQ